MEVYEVFRRSGHKDPFEHCGAVTASDPEMALLVAKECFFRRQEGHHLWVVKRADIHSFSDESLLELAGDKSYRFPEAYRDVIELRERAQERARNLKAAEETSDRLDDRGQQAGILAEGAASARGRREIGEIG